MTRLLFDIETNGLLDKLDQVHSLVIKDVDTGEVWSCDDHRIHDESIPSKDNNACSIHYGIRDVLAVADEIIGHNIIKFDIPALQKVYPWFSVEGIKVTDTLVCSRLIWTDLKDRDFKLRKKHPDYPGNLIGSHGLEAWGHRSGVMKGDYAKERKAKAKELGITDKEALDDFVWGSWNPEMQAYCEQDVEVTEWLYRKILEKNYSQQALDLEHAVAEIMWRTEQRGFTFDVEGANKLVAELMTTRAQIEDELQKTFKPWWKSLGEVTPKRTVNPKKDLAKAGTWAAGVYTKITREVFNPGSRDHIAARLQSIRNWKPVQFTDSGKPKVDEDVLSDLSWPEAKLLVRYLTVQKRLGQIAEGDKAWLKFYDENARINAGYTTGGAVTGRATHSNPNIGQVPKVQANKDGILFGEAGGWGAECRALFGPSKGHVLVGCDLSGLELRMLGHFMARWDKGAYIKTLLEGDIHTVNQEAAGLPSRDNAKTFIYGFLYGAGDAKIGSIVGKGRQAGGVLRKRFLHRLPALGKLVKGVKEKVKATGVLKGLDGRLLHIRSDHAALNTLLQSAGALISKQWIVEFDKLLRENGLHNSARILAWVHDELQIECLPEDSELVASLAIKAANLAGQHFNMRCPIDAEAKVGTNWKETH